MEYRKGLGFIGSSGDPARGGGRSRPDTTAEFDLLRGSVALTQQLPPFFEIYTEFLYQYTGNDPLPSFEEFSLGELTVGRGFEPGSALGDTGWGGHIEMRFRPPGIDEPWLDDIYAYGFYDIARTFDFEGANNDGKSELESAGFGVRFQMYETLFGDFYLVHPIRGAPSNTIDTEDTSVKFILTQYF